MNADHPAPTDGLSIIFPASAETGPEVSGPSRFAAALKRARFAKGWTQAALATHSGLPKRSIVSWETAERIPSIGLVVLLLDALSSEDALSLHRELITAYIADDLERQQRRAGHQGASVLRQLRRLRERVAQLSAPPDLAGADSVRPDLAADGPERRAAPRPLDAPEPQGEGEGEPEGQTPQPSQGGDRQALEPLFALMSRLQRHPELIAVAGDFIRELAPDD
jgi:transcriptional regulator with XRE-family HTH domain